MTKLFNFSLILIIGSLAFISCRSTKPTSISVPVRTTERIVERLVKVQSPADSTNIVALFECNDQNQVILRQLTEEKSKHIQSAFTFASGQLKYNASTKPDIVYLPVKDSIIYKEIPIRVEVPVEVNKITGWQYTQIYTGRILFTILLLFVGYKTFKNKIG